jgi:hypothetical protein
MGEGQTKGLRGQSNNEEHIFDLQLLLQLRRLEVGCDGRHHDTRQSAGVEYERVVDAVGGEPAGT